MDDVKLFPPAVKHWIYDLAPKRRQFPFCSLPLLPTSLHKLNLPLDRSFSRLKSAPEVVASMLLQTRILTFRLSLIQAKWKCRFLSISAQTLVRQARTKASPSRNPIDIWATLHQEMLSPSMPFEEVHQEAHAKVYADTNDHNKPTWIPSPCSPATNIQTMMARKGFQTYQELYEWSIQNRNEFWIESAKMIGKL